MKRFTITFAIFFSAAWLMLQLSTDQNKPTPPAPTQHLEWFGKNITLTEMDNNGHIKQTIHAQHLQHYMPDNITDLSDVNVEIISDKDKHKWLLTSGKARLFHGEKKQEITRIDLWQQVQLVRPAEKLQDVVKINTSTLAVFPEKEYAHTDQYTVVQQPGQLMSGEGMEIFFPTQKFILLNNVSSKHENAS